MDCFMIGFFTIYKNANNKGVREDSELTNSTLYAKKRIGGALVNENPRRPRLFGGSLDEYVELSGEPIPLIVMSTIRLVYFSLLLGQSKCKYRICV